MRPTSFRLVMLASLMAPTLQAQIEWARFEEDAALVVAADHRFAADTTEREYAWGDLDQDGWTDLVIARKEPYMSTVPRENVLLMNLGGTLMDRTGVFASSSDVPGDQGFLTATNDRDIVVADVNGDGWLDVITAATLSPGTPKHISHPRVYVNLGAAVGGQWLGLRHEAGRIPDFGTFPNFGAVGVGDVTGDGLPDLYFSHNDKDADVDLNDRLLVNDGTGHFVDESQLRMNAEMLKSHFGLSAAIQDMNSDGVRDVVRTSGVSPSGGPPRTRVIYNDPGQTGFFVLLQDAYQGSPYYASVGDLNADGLPDLVISDDGSDRYLLNQGNDGVGRVIWSGAHTYNTDDGFGSNSLVTDLDGDGWNDVLIADVDAEIPGCTRRVHIYHNQGGTVGGMVTLHEESGQGSRGVEGMTTGDMGGTHDVAVFDLDNDGDLDLILGRCDQSNVWVNQLSDPGESIGDAYCDPAVDNSTGAPGRIHATGSDLVILNDVTLHATQLPANQFGYFLVSQTQGFVPNPGGSDGNLCLGGTLGRFSDDVLNSGDAGQFSLGLDLTDMPAPVQTAVHPGESWYFSAWYRDLGQTSNFTNGVRIDFL